jgi:hypothetical protein
MTCTTFRAYEDTPEVGMAGMETYEGGMKSPVISANHAGMQFFMESDINDISVRTHERMVDVTIFLPCVPGYASRFIISHCQN